MGWWIFGSKKDKEIDSVKEEIRGSFDSVKRDIHKTNSWIKHLHDKDNHHESKIEQVYDEILEIKQDIDGIKSCISFFDTRLANKMFKHKQEVFNKQTPVYGVQTPVQTAVQTAFLRGLTGNERLIVWTLLNTEMKLSYEDIAVLLGKDKTTVRVQLNNIKQKVHGVINETAESSGKKRYYVDEKVREMLLSKIKTKTKNIKREKNKNE